MVRENAVYTIIKIGRHLYILLMYEKWNKMINKIGVTRTINDCILESVKAILFLFERLFIATLSVSWFGLPKKQCKVNNTFPLCQLK